ncbi:MAG: helix-hairpin-helix domain-containing protein [Thermoplasmatales archaeon]|nr:helix-hairpin-helix domain-containing protein [Thermoplasmatales archaeon]
MPRKIEKIYSGDRIVRIRILPKVKREVEKIERRGEEVKKEIVEAGKEIKEATAETVEKAEEKIAEVKEKIEMTVDEAVTVFTKIPTITKEKATSLYNAGYNSLSGLARAPAEKLLTIKNITLENVKNIKKELKGFYEEEVKPRVEKIEKTPAEKSITWIEDVTKKAISVGKDVSKKAVSGAVIAKDKISKTYKKLATPEKPKLVEKKVKIKSKKKKVKTVQKKKTVKPVKRKKTKK